MTVEDRINKAWDVFIANAPMGSLYPNSSGNGAAFEAHKEMEDMAEIFVGADQASLAEMSEIAYGKWIFVCEWARHHRI